jgi:DUF3102 family protein
VLHVRCRHSGAGGGAVNGDIVAFDYSALSQENAEDLDRAAKRIRSLVERMGINIIAIGRELGAAKDKLGHGRFMAWLEAEFSWSDRTARRFMQAAAILGEKVDSVAILEPSAIYLLSAPSTSDSVREKVLRRLDEGEKLSTSKIKGIVAAERGQKAQMLSPMAKLRSRIVELEQDVRAANERADRAGSGSNIDFDRDSLPAMARMAARELMTASRIERFIAALRKEAKRLTAMEKNAAAQRPEPPDPARDSTVQAPAAAE